MLLVIHPAGAPALHVSKPALGIWATALHRHEKDETSDRVQCQSIHRNLLLCEMV